MNRPLALAPALALGGCLALAAAMGIGRFALTPILPEMIEALGLSKSQAGAIASANYLGYLLGAMAGSTSLLRGDSRRWFIAALAVSAASSAAMGLSGDLYWLGLMRFAGGFASAVLLVFASALVLERLARMGRTGLNGIHFAGVGAGITVSAVIVALLVADGRSWEVQWAVCGAVALVLAALAILLVPPVQEGQADDPASRMEAQEDKAAYRAFLIAYSLQGYGYVITATFLTTVVRNTPDLAPHEAALWACFGLAAIPSVVLWNALAQRKGIAFAFGIACLVEAAGVAVSVLSSHPAAIALAAACVGGTFMALTALGLLKARAVAVGDPRRAIGLMTAGFSLGQIIGPIAAGVMADMFGSFLVPSLSASAAMVAAAILVLPRREGRPTATG